MNNTYKWKSLQLNKVCPKCNVGYLISITANSVFINHKCNYCNFETSVLSIYPKIRVKNNIIKERGFI